MQNWFVASAAITSILLIVTYPLRAQEGDAVSATLTVGQRFESTENLGLETPSEGRSNLSTTSLGLDLITRNSTQTLSFSAGGVVRNGDIPATSDISTGFTDPRINLSYSREGYNSTFNASGSFRQSDIASRDLSQFVNADGEFELPEDFEDLVGGGQRNTFGFSSSLVIGQDAPLSVTFSGSVNATRYEDVTSPNLTDTTRSRIGVTSRLRFSPSTTGSVGIGLERFENENAVGTQRDTYSLVFGISNVLANATTVNAELGYEAIETRETTGDRSDGGLVGQFGVVRQMPNGTVSADVESTVDQAGNRLTLQAGRSLELPTGTISSSVGLTSFEGDSPDFVGTLNWVQALPRGTLTARINRDVTTNNDDRERISTSGAVSFTQQINSVSSYTVGTNFGVSEDSAISRTTTQAAVTVSYNRAINNRWGFNTGVTHRLRDTTLNGRADSTSIFFGLNASFDLLNRE